MKSFYCLFAIICASNAFRFYENDPNMPIKEVRGDQGLNDHDRVQYLKAVIEPHHLSDTRVDFLKTVQLETYFREAAAPGDERGHLVASQFSGPPVWYNLSPQNPRVNRNAGYQSITIDWYNTECNVKTYLKKGGNRSVVWEVTMTYEGKSNRPKVYSLIVTFYEGSKQVDQITTDIQNAFLDEDREHWICRECRASKHKADEPRCDRAKA